MASPLEVTELLGVIRDFYGTDAKGQYKFSPTERTAALWCDDMDDLPVSELWLAFKQHRNGPGGEWPPSPGQLRKHVTTITRPELPDWGEAWDEVLTAIRQCGSYSEPPAESWGNALIPRVIRGMGGWKAMCAMEVENAHVDRAQFRMLYEAAVSRATRTADLLPDVRALAVKNGALPAPVEPAPKALPAPVEAPRARTSEPRSVAAVLPLAVKTDAPKPKNADDEYRERVKRAKADPTGPEAQAFAVQADQMRRAALAIATRRTEEASHA